MKRAIIGFTMTVLVSYRVACPLFRALDQTTVSTSELAAEDGVASKAEPASVALIAIKFVGR